MNQVGAGCRKFYHSLMLAIWKNKLTLMWRLMIQFIPRSSNQVIPVFLCNSDPSPRIVDLGAHVERGTHRVVSRWQHAHDELRVGRSNYSGCFGSTEIEDSPLKGNGVFFANSEIRLSDIRDGASNTIMIGERTNEIGAVSWVGMVPEVDEPFARVVATADHAPNGPDGHFEDFRSSHPSGINVTLVDGSTHFINDNIDDAAWAAAATRSGRDKTSIHQE